MFTKKVFKIMRVSLIPYFLIIPAIVILVALIIYPLVFSLSTSLSDFSLRKTSSYFIGLTNYWDAFHDEEFLISLKNTLGFVAGMVSLEFFLGLVIALLSIGELRGIGFFRSLLVVPFSVAPVVVGLMWRYMAFKGGIVSYFLSLIGFQPPRGLLGEAFTARVMVVAADTWEWTGFMALILIAGLLSIPQEVYDSGQIDGASNWQTLKHITLPLLKPVILIALILRTMDAFCIYDVIYALTMGGPGSSTNVVSLYIYRTAMRYGKLGYASALSWIVLLVVICISLLYIKIAYGKEEI